MRESKLIVTDMVDDLFRRIDRIVSLFVKHRTV